MRALIPFVITVAAAPGCNMDMVVVEAEAKEVCLSGLHLDVPALPDLGEDVDAVERDVIEDQLPDIIPNGLTASARLTGVGMTLTNGPENFAFVDKLRVDIAGADPDAPLPMVPLIDVGDVEDAPVLFLEGDDTADLVEYLRTEALQLGVAIQGDLPREKWGVDLDVCFSIEASYRR